MIFTFSFPVTLTFDLQTSNLFPQLLLSSTVCTKLEVSTTFLFGENRRHRTDGQTDGRSAALNAAPREGHIIKCDCVRIGR